MPPKILHLAPKYFGKPSDDPDAPPQEYIPHPHLLTAARLAYALGRPLLLTGEPGCGKTDFAWVLAQQLGQTPDERRPLICRVSSQTRAQDLLYHYDALRRLADAQLGGDHTLVRDPRHYVELRELGLGLMRGGRRVVLIDEIDKAPKDLPNDLLHVVEEGWFRIPELPRVSAEPAVADPHGVPLANEMKPDRALGRPLILITSNAERHLPEPFLRRCVFFHLPFPIEDDLRLILKSRLPDQEPKLQARQVATFLALRQQNLAKPPSTAELCDWAESFGHLPKPSAATLMRFADALDETTGRPSPDSGLSWRDLPGLPCLVKLHEDLQRLGAEADPRLVEAS
ncbi:MAG: MoxR family ATPase [Deltaproteobacteria bacterium]|nr:MoxR family ATPase [Deltaproteobacteria bacterium]